MEPIASTAYGKVRGFTEEDASVFLGIPFAAPPVGEHRFLPPVLPDAWDGVRDALVYGPTAPQRDPGITIIPEPVEPGDDFLNLNVFTPDLGDARLPVLVWIHGGGWVSGCNRSPWYRGTRFARDGVVVVCVGYRLGVEGFLDVEDAPPNRAVSDWIFGLEWVQNNVSSFGGDPSNVTIAGQSAGSAACVILMTNPRARGLFHRVIGMSGTSDTRMPREQSTELARLIADHLGVKPTREDLSRFDPEQLVDAHLEVAKNVFTADALTAGFDPRGPALKPFVDGDVIPDHPFRAIQQGIGSDIPLVAGSTAEEVNGAIWMRRADLEKGGATAALQAMGFEGDKLDAYLAHVGTTDHVEALAQAATDRAFRTTLAHQLDDRAANGGCTFGYQFKWRPPTFDGAIGAAHCLDIPFAWDNLDAERVADGLIGPNPPQELADAMHASWAGFVKDGDPRWPAYELEDRKVMEFDVPSAVADDPLRFERELS